MFEANRSAIILTAKAYVIWSTMHQQDVLKMTDSLRPPYSFRMSHDHISRTLDEVLMTIGW